MLEVLLVKIARGDQEGLLRALEETLRIFLEAVVAENPGAQRREVVSQLVTAVGLETRGVLEGGVHSAQTFALQVAARLEQAASRREEGGGQLAARAGCTAPPNGQGWRAQPEAARPGPDARTSHP